MCKMVGGTTLYKSKPYMKLLYFSTEVMEYATVIDWEVLFLFPLTYLRVISYNIIKLIK